MAKKYDMADPSHTLTGVEIFAVGRWNGDPYTVEDLDNMIENFKSGVIKNVPLKVGHDDFQEFAGQPAVGIVENLYRVGKKLLADIKNIPKLVAEAINKKAYLGVSSEIAWNVEFDETIYNKLLIGVSLLGAEIPAVNSLEAIPAVYNFKELKVYNFETKQGGIMMEKTAEELKKEEEAKLAEDKKIADEVVAKKVEEEAEAAKKAEEVAEAAKKAEEVKEEPKEEPKEEVKEVEDVQKENANLKKELEAFKAKEISLKKEAEEKEVKEFVNKLFTDKKITPAIKDSIELSLLKADNTIQHKYTVNKEEKQETVRGLLKQVYSALKELEIYKEFAASDDHSAGTPEEKAIALANKYSVEKEINFSKALLEVYKEHPEYIGEVKSMSK